MSYINQLRNLFRSLVTPRKLLTLNLYSEYNSKEKIIQFLRIFFSAELITIVAGIFQLISTTILFGLFNYDVRNDKIAGFLPDISMYSRNLTEFFVMFLFVIFMAGLIGPVIEELTFRLHLRFTMRNISISLGLFIGYFLLSSNILTIAQSRVETKDLLFPLVIQILVIIFLILFAYFFLKKSHLGPRLKSLYDNHFNLIFYLNILFFGLIHMSNFSNMPMSLWIFAPILTIVQLWLGFVFSYIRMRFGIVFAIFAHMIHNLSILFVFIMIEMIIYLNSVR